MIVARFSGTALESFWKFPNILSGSLAESSCKLPVDFRARTILGARQTRIFPKYHVVSGGGITHAGHTDGGNGGDGRALPFFAPVHRHVQARAVHRAPAACKAHASLSEVYIYRKMVLKCEDYTLRPRERSLCTERMPRPVAVLRACR